MEDSEENDPLIAETRWLLSLPEEARIAYVNSVLKNLAEGLKQIAKTEAPLEKLKQAQQFFEELNSKANVIMPPVIYAIRPEFHETFKALLKELSNL
ncbi:MAG: hypothetical protein QXI87_09500 [Thermoproteota archaeon]